MQYLNWESQALLSIQLVRKYWLRFWASCSYWYNEPVQAVVALKLLILSFLPINAQWDRVTYVHSLNTQDC